MNKELEGWENFLKEAKEYHKTLNGSINRPKVFTPPIIHNLAAMAIEKYLMALFMKNGQLPRNHTMTDLLEEACGLLVIDEELERTLKYMDSLKQICSMDSITITPPKMEDVPCFMNAVNKIAELTGDKLGHPVITD